MYWFQTKEAVMKTMKCSLEYSWNPLFKSCASLSSSSCHARHIFTQARSVLHTQSLILPLTLCVWPTVPFTLIKTTNVSTLPLPRLLNLHRLPLWQLKPRSHWLLWCHSLNNCLSPHSSLFPHSHLREVCRRDWGHRLWRANIHRVPQCCYKEVRERTRGTSSSIRLHPTSSL